MTDTTLALIEGRRRPPIGASQSAEELLVCALLCSEPPAVEQIAEYVNADADLDEPARSIYSAAIDVASQGISPTGDLIFDELRRVGRLDRRTACWLAAAAASRRPPDTARRYAAIVVAGSARRQIESWGSALATLATTASETELRVTFEIFAVRIADAFARLATLRGDWDD